LPSSPRNVHSPGDVKNAIRIPPTARGAIVLLAGILAGSTGACRPESQEMVDGPIGSPLPGLAPDELARFEAGRSLFARPFSPEAGIGPLYNENACNACHTDPADGGTGEQLVTRASRSDMETGCDPLRALGGENLRRQATPLLRALAGEAAPVPVPPRATHVGRFTTPFLFGVGLVDAIPVESIRAREDPDDRDGDGISGRMGTDALGRPARFGRKSNVADLETFVDEALRFEMGLTTERSPDESAAGSIPPTPDSADVASDPEVDRATFDALTDFVRMLAPPEPATPPTETARRTVQRGARIFSSLGCDQCHVPEMRTGEASLPALSDKRFLVYSDLLLHDMGAALEGPCTSGTAPSEYRTEPLIGLRYRNVYLHDGRAGRVMDAILLHGGEASAARDAFAELDRITQEDLLRFLNTL
jgi:CxxC motif-containing protein (DUF1111 family)